MAGLCNIEIGIYLLYINVWIIYGAAIECNNSTVHDQYCIYHGGGQVNWEKAVEHCNSDGGHLATVPDMNDTTVLEGLADGLAADQFWIGGRREINKSGKDDNPKAKLWRWLSECSTCGNNETESELAALLKQGCYAEWYTDLDLGERVLDNDNTMTIQSCQDSCNKIYVATEHGDRCTCGDVFGRHGVTSDCTVGCYGNTNEHCGGLGRHTVYKRGGLVGEWNYNEPSRTAGYYCGAVDSNNNYKLVAKLCSMPKRFLCHLPSRTNDSCAGTEPGDYFIATDTCYFWSDAITSLTSWFMARQACVQMDGDLASMPTEEIYSQLRSQLAAYPAVAERYTWIGLAKFIWYWQNGADIKYNKFTTNEPNSPSDECVYMEKISDAYVWRTSDCAADKAFFCRQGIPGDTSTVPPSTTIVPTAFTTATTDLHSPQPSSHSVPITATKQTTQSTTKMSATDTIPITQTPKPTTQTPKPTTQTPKPTTPTPKPTTQKLTAKAEPVTNATKAPTTQKATTNIATTKVTTTAGPTITETRNPPVTTAVRTPRRTPGVTTGRPATNGPTSGPIFVTPTAGAITSTGGLTNADVTPTAGAITSTGGLTNAEIGLIILGIVLLIVLIIAIVFIVKYYKTNRHDVVSPESYDARGEAALALGGSFSEGYAAEPNPYTGENNYNSTIGAPNHAKAAYRSSSQHPRSKHYASDPWNMH